MQMHATTRRPISPVEYDGTKDTSHCPARHVDKSSQSHAPLLLTLTAQHFVTMRTSPPGGQLVRERISMRTRDDHRMRRRIDDARGHSRLQQPWVLTQTSTPDASPRIYHSTRIRARSVTKPHLPVVPEREPPPQPFCIPDCFGDTRRPASHHTDKPHARPTHPNQSPYMPHMREYVWGTHPHHRRLHSLRPLLAPRPPLLLAPPLPAPPQHLLLSIRPVPLPSSQRTPPCRPSRSYRHQTP